MSTLAISEPVLLEPSVATALTALLPSPPGTVQLALYGSVVSVEMEFHEPLEQFALAFEHSKNSTCERSVSPLVAVSVSEAGSDALTYCGVWIVTVGAWLSISTFVTSADVVELPALSVAVARRS